MNDDRPETKVTILDLELAARDLRIIAATNTTEHGCPRCGERRADYLVWQADDEMVECSTCGHRYQP
jgi:DNA-directed RNA polymerase subunit M/transcription elongation factor TFIIS